VSKRVLVKAFLLRIGAINLLVAIDLPFEPFS
jgi:hypothetical protein